MDFIYLISQSTTELFVRIYLFVCAPATDFATLMLSKAIELVIVVSNKQNTNVGLPGKVLDASFHL